MTGLTMQLLNIQVCLCSTFILVHSKVIQCIGQNSRTVIEDAGQVNM
jgi:hypothetical protein